MNLYKLGKKKNFGEIMVANKFEPTDNWLPPGYCIPDSNQNSDVLGEGCADANAFLFNNEEGNKPLEVVQSLGGKADDPSMKVLFSKVYFYQN